MRLKLVHYLMFVLLIGLVLPIVGGSLIISYLNYKQEVGEAQELLDNSIESLLLTTTHAVWNLDKQDLETSVQIAFKNNYFKEISVFHSDGRVFFESKSETSSGNTSLQERKIQILHENKQIGTLLVKYSLEQINSSIRRTIELVLIATFFGVALSFGLLFFLIREKILVPLDKISKQANMLSHGSFHMPFNWNDGDEISNVGSNLELLRQQLATMITDLEDKNAKLYNSNADLERKVHDKSLQMVSSAKLASLGEMASGIAHEINNPLAIIQGKAQIIFEKLKKENPDLAKCREDLEKIISTSQRIVKIIKGLRTFSRSNENDPMSEENLFQIFDETLAFCSEKLKKYGVELKTNIPRHVLLNCHPTQLSQVFLNLLNNSADAVVENSEKWVTVTCEKINSQVIKLTFTDSGGGIPEHIAEKLMQPFFTTKPPGKGTGLGLSVSKGIIENHGGKFSLNRDCKNTQFVIELPYLQKNIEKSVA